LSARTAVRLALLVVAAAGTAAAFGSPRFTWQNEGLRVDHPPRRAVAALVAAAAVAAAGLSGRSRPAAAAGLAAAAALAVLGADRLVWRVEAVQDGLHERTVAGARTIAWSDVERVEPRPDALRLRARDGTEIVVRASGFAPEDRTRLERTIARRVREAAR
jgi:Bacterial PH domain